MIIPRLLACEMITLCSRVTCSLFRSTLISLTVGFAIELRDNFVPVSVLGKRVYWELVVAACASFAICAFAKLDSNNLHTSIAILSVQDTLIAIKYQRSYAPRHMPVLGMTS